MLRGINREKSQKTARPLEKVLEVARPELREEGEPVILQKGLDRGLVELALEV
eukprot:XP_001707783.1 Hypothetical protein GL50803_38553 [Giardia lamblia ATCC 50803]